MKCWNNKVELVKVECPLLAIIDLGGRVGGVGGGLGTDGTQGVFLNCRYRCVLLLDYSPHQTVLYSVF